MKQRSMGWSRSVSCISIYYLKTITKYCNCARSFKASKKWRRYASITRPQELKSGENWRLVQWTRIGPSQVKKSVKLSKKMQDQPMGKKKDLVAWSCPARKENSRKAKRHLSFIECPSLLTRWSVIWFDIAFPLCCDDEIRVFLFSAFLGLALINDWLTPL